MFLVINSVRKAGESNSRGGFILSIVVVIKRQKAQVARNIKGVQIRKDVDLTLQVADLSRTYIPSD